MNHRKLIVLVLAMGVAIVLRYCLRPTQKVTDTGVVPPSSEFPTEFIFLPKIKPRTANSVPEAERFASACFQSYDHFFSKETISMHIAFGYKDSRPARFVGDRYERLVVLSYLLSPCIEGWHACGFTRKRDDADLLFKKTTGPDGRNHHVKIRITHSSVGADDDVNRKDPLQKQQSKISRENFLEGMRSGDLVFYNGHSRDGGGPDFDPPRIGKTGHLDYSWYVKSRVGEKMLLSAMSGDNNPVIGLFSCRSSVHFLEKLGQKKSKAPTITSPQLLFYADAQRSLLGALNGILGQWCEPSFSETLNSGVEFGRAKLTNFFK